MTRLDELAQGNYIIVYQANSGVGQLQETLLIVTEKIQTGDKWIIKASGLQKTPYSGWAQVQASYSTEQNLQFAKVSYDQAQHWLLINNTESDLAKALLAAKTTVTTTEAQVGILQQLKGDLPMYIEQADTKELS